MYLIQILSSDSIIAIPSVKPPTGFGQVTLQGQRQLVLADYLQCLSSTTSLNLGTILEQQSSQQSRSLRANLDIIHHCEYSA